MWWIMYTSSANTTPLCGTIINSVRFIGGAGHFGPQRFLERHGMLCASGRWVRVMGPNDFSCCKRSLFLFAFYWWPNWGEIFYTAAFMNRQFESIWYFFMIYVNCLEKLICPLQSPYLLDWHFHPFPTQLGPKPGVVDTCWAWYRWRLSPGGGRALPFQEPNKLQPRFYRRIKLRAEAFHIFFGWGFDSTSASHVSWWNKFQDSFCWFIFWLLLNCCGWCCRLLTFGNI